MPITKDKTIKYKTTWHDFLVVCNCMLFPIWGLVGTLGLVFSVFAMLNLHFNLMSGLICCVLCVSVVFCGFLTTAISFDYALTLNASGLVFPLLFLPSLNFRRDRSWADLARVRFLGGSGPLRKGSLDLIFKSGGRAKLGLMWLKTDDIERILIALEVWAKDAQKDPEIALLQNQLHDKVHLSGAQSFTQLWESEVSRRFTSTAFVPLSNGKALQGGRLTVEKQIAFGGLSAIYLAQLNAKESVVLKEFVIHDTDSEIATKALELFQREAQLLAKLNHPQIARVRDHFTEDGRTYVLLDYVRGEDLRKLVHTQGPQKEAQVLKWAEEIANILFYLHSQKPPVVHRDLTPDNLVLSQNNKITIIDFGAANDYMGTATGTLVGKQAYISPEQFRGEANAQSDIYSLGATMHFLLTGHEPEPLTQSSPSSITKVSEFMNRLVEDCTAFDEEERIKSAEEFIERLQAKTPTVDRVSI